VADTEAGELAVAADCGGCEPDGSWFVAPLVATGGDAALPNALARAAPTCSACRYSATNPNNSAYVEATSDTDGRQGRSEESGVESTHWCRYEANGRVARRHWKTLER